MAYLNVDEIESALVNLAQAYPNESKLIELPHKTIEGRKTHAISIGSRSASAIKTVLIVGGIHAREWVPPDALVYLAADLLEAFGSSTGLRYEGKYFSKTDIKNVFDNLKIVLYPCANPDGRNYSQNTESMWRKNRNPNTGAPCKGVDINRNFDVLWDFPTYFAPGSVSASQDTCKDIFIGSSAASEPETKNVAWLIQQPNVGWFIDVHSAIPAIFHSWGIDENQSTDPTMNFQNAAYNGVRGRTGDSNYKEYIPVSDLDECKRLSKAMAEAIKAVNNNDYSVSQAFDLYSTSGASDDFAYSLGFKNGGQDRIFGFTIECGTEFQPPWNQAQMVMREVCAGLIEFMVSTLTPSSFQPLVHESHAE
ncbi:MAG: hypothetical protein K2Y39_09580 [Candidatus Obscuribacterales bacterium]|nr:hypothetical protein [Candidatus Obscuribacterales bacterium]